MKYNIDVKITGFETVTVYADTLEEAEEKASDEVFNHLVSDLRWKEVSCTQQGEVT